MKTKLPAYTKKLFLPKRFKILYGGRGSSKSTTIADILLILGAQKRIRVLCAREFQNSIAESVHYLLKAEISRLGLTNNYTITNNSISGKNGTEFIFKGIRMNIESIKSMAGITHVWIEEAQTVSKNSWDVLIPTIREENSEIWACFNPNSADDPVFEMFVQKNGEPKELENAIILKVNWEDNPFFPKILQDEKDYLYKVNPSLADHVWGGKCRNESDAQIFKNKFSIAEYTTDDVLDGPYFGADWGFSVDPTALVKCYINKSKRILYVSDAKFGYGVDIDKLPALFDQVPESRKYQILADNARPETISYISQRGFNIWPVDKWKGSVEDGIEFLKSFEKIIIKPSLVEMAEEFKRYSYKTDRLSGQVQPDIVDAYNHGIDALRYALEPIIKAGSISILQVL